MKIVFDPPKRLANLDKHGLDMAALTLEFFANAAFVPAKEGRTMAVGSFDGRMIAVVFQTLGAEAISIVSMRPAGKKERGLL